MAPPHLPLLPLSPPPPSLPARAFAEFCCSLMLTFVDIAHAASVDPDVIAPEFHFIMICFLLVGILETFGPISSHTVSTVSLGMFLVGHIRLIELVIFTLSHILGSAVAGFIVRGFLEGTDGYAKAKAGLFLIPVETHAETREGALKAITCEMVLTMILIHCILHLFLDQKDNHRKFFAAAMVVSANIFAGGRISGACMNPSRAVGGAIAAMYVEIPGTKYAHAWRDAGFYVVGTSIGTLAAVLLFRLITSQNPEFRVRFCEDSNSVAPSHFDGDDARRRLSDKDSVPDDAALNIEVAENAAARNTLPRRAAQPVTAFPLDEEPLPIEGPKDGLKPPEITEPSAEDEPPSVEPDVIGQNLWTPTPAPRKSFGDFSA